MIQQNYEQYNGKRKVNTKYQCDDHTSVWTNTVDMQTYPHLQKNITTKVAIIGGGLCGILCAYFLKEAGVDCVVIEGKRIGGGITQNTTAKVTSQHGLIYHNLIQRKGVDAAKQYFWANQRAVEQYRKLCKSIDCDFETKSAYAYSTENNEKIKQEVEAMQRLGFCVDYLETLPLPFPIQGAVKFPDQAQIHPLKFIAALSQDLTIYENTFVTKLRPHKIQTEKGHITADKIIVATHFPFLNKHGSYFLKMYQERSYVLALKNAQNLGGMYLGVDIDGLSFRNYKDLLLLGGGGHRTGKSGKDWEVLQNFARKYYPDAEVCYKWATQDCMTLDSVPYIGPYSKYSKDLYVATGFNKWGMTSSMVAADIIKDMVQGKENAFSAVFSPHRNMIKPQLFVNGMEAVKNLLTPAGRRCSHLGCALKWNKSEHTWDCPCHGSRFQKNGKLIDNPATGNIKVK